MKNIILSLIVSTLMLSGSAAFARGQVHGGNLELHPNLAAAQKLSRKAFEKIEAAQKAHEYDMEGHVQKAKDLLDQVNQELKLAIEAANKNKEK